MSWRFTTEKDEGGWRVQDNEYVAPHTKLPRVVAVCSEQKEADAIAAFMNGDLEGGRRLHHGFLSFLEACRKS